jgi:Na+/phosphate symporter
MTAAVNLEGLANVIEIDMRNLMYQSARLQQVTGEDTRKLLEALYQDVSEALYLAVKALRDADQQAAEPMLAQTLMNLFSNLFGNGQRLYWKSVVLMDNFCGT